MDSSPEFVKQLLYSLRDIADSTHFVAALYCSRAQQNEFLTLCTPIESVFTCSPLYFESLPTIPNPSILPSNGLQFGVLLFLRNQMPDNDKIRKPPLQSNTFSVSRFGKGRRSNHPKFPFRKNYRVAAHLISIYVPDPNHRIVELFAGSCSSIPAAHLLHRSMDFVEKDAVMYGMYKKKAEDYFETYRNTTDYYLATITRKLKWKRGGELLYNSDEEIPNDADDYRDPLQLKRLVARYQDDSDDDDDANPDDDDDANPDDDDDANPGKVDQDENEDYVLPAAKGGNLRLPKESSSEGSGSENEEGNNF